MESHVKSFKRKRREPLIVSAACLTLKSGITKVIINMLDRSCRYADLPEHVLDGCGQRTFKTFLVKCGKRKPDDFCIETTGYEIGTWFSKHCKDQVVFFHVPLRLLTNVPYPALSRNTNNTQKMIGG